MLERYFKAVFKAIVSGLNVLGTDLPTITPVAKMSMWKSVIFLLLDRIDYC